MHIFIKKPGYQNISEYKPFNIINYTPMEINYTIIALAVLVAIIVIILLIRKNRKDQKDFEQKMNQESIDPEHHKEERI